jgi:hypothetical protein
MGVDINVKQITFTDEQRKTITQTVGICIVNAGPGTGKTTTANEKAYQLQNEGVLLVSYTNEAINENYNRLFYYPRMKGIMGKKKYPKKLTVTTADSLAAYINGGIADSYDEVIRKAINKLEDRSKGQIIIPYNHLIIDEAQDIDEIRGSFLVTLYIYGYVKSITIFGDPRQRINSRAGQWYQDLWASNIVHDDLIKIGLTKTHRFMNTGLLNLANHLSLQRPSLHVQLENNTTENTIPIDLWQVQYNNEDSDVKRLCDYLKQLNSEGISYNSMTVVGPSIHRDNQTSKTAKKICAVFRDQDIPCYTSSEGSFLPSGIKFSTIHCAKGKEYDIVIIFGMNNFPDTFKEIPYEEADSLIYVAHTRAKKQIIYLGDYPFTPPRHVPESFIKSQASNAIAKRKSNIHPTTMCFPISDLSDNHDFLRLLEVNSGYSVPIDSERICANAPKVGPAQFDPRLWGIFCGIGVEMFLINKYFDNLINLATNKYICVCDKEYRKMVREGKIYRGMNRDGKLVINEESIVNNLRDDERKDLGRIVTIPLEELTWNEWKNIIIAFDFITNGHMNSRYDLREIKEISIPDFKSIATWLKKNYGGTVDTSVSTEGMVEFSYLRGQYDAYLGETLFEFKTSSKDEPTNAHKLQIIMYDACLSAKDKIIYNLENGTLFKISSSKCQEWWLYMMQSYAIIRNHVTYTEYFRGKQIELKGSLPKIKENIYVCDTEFTGLNGIFDLAYVNVSDPYKSVLQTLNPGERNIVPAVNWISEHTSDWSDEKLFRLLMNSPKDINTILDRLEPRSEFHYYVCNIDVMPITNLLSSKIDISSKIRTIAKWYGSNLNTGSPPKLGDIYGKIVFPLEFQEHLQVHTALSDALMLYTMIRCGYVLVQPEIIVTEGFQMEIL